jgi:hypothetical protein
VNAAIRTGIVSSTFYTNTDPATRRELLRQVYTEVVRQLRGYTDIIPAKHPKAKPVAAGAAPKPSASAPYSVRVKIEGASPAIANEATYAGKDSKGRDKLEIPAQDKDAALLAAEQMAKLAKQGSTLHGGTIYAVRIAHGDKESEVYVAGPTIKLVPAKPGIVGYGAMMSAAIKGKTEKVKAPPGVPYDSLGLTKAEAEVLKKYRMPYGYTEFSVIFANGKFYVQITPDLLLGTSHAKASKAVGALGSVGWKLVTGAEKTAAKALPELPMFSISAAKKNPRRTRRAPRRRAR